MSSALELKAEGNIFFAQKNFLQASEKYTKAIKIESSNAILYSNRAACWLNLRQHYHAVLDATKATELDPSYTKAHIRLGIARDCLKQPWNSTVIWKNALETLPAELTDAQRKEKETIDLALAKATEKLEALNPKNIPTSWRGTYKFPIIQHCALGMMPDLRRNQDYNSCAWYLSNAYLHLEKSFVLMNAYQKKPEGMEIVPEAIYHFSEAVLRDRRVFSPLRHELYNWTPMLAQVKDEIRYYEAWPETTAAETVIEEAAARVEQEGWDVIRPVLETTIRAWITFGMVSAILRSEALDWKSYDIEADFVSRAVEVIRRGREVWKDVDPTVRGRMFDIEYYHAVENLYLDALQKPFPEETNSNRKKERGEKMMKEAEHLIESVEKYGSPELPQVGDPSDAVAFFARPWCTGMKSKGLYLAYQGEQTRALDHRMEGILGGGTSLTRSSKHLPEDDLSFAYHTSAGFMIILSSPGYSLKACLELSERLRRGKERSLRIWGEHHYATTNGQEIEDVVMIATAIEERLKKGLETGRYRHGDLLYGIDQRVLGNADIENRKVDIVIRNHGKGEIVFDDASDSED